MKNENFCRIMILILLLSSMSPLLQFAGIDIVDIAKAEILDDFQTGWDHYVRFTIDHDFIDEDLTAFPMLVVLNSTIGGAANGGNSLRFLSDDLTEQYYYEIDTWNPAGDSYVWVRINHTSSDEDTNVVMFYGNATAVGQNSTEVWDSHYIGVWHMNDNATGAGINDSTSNGIVGTKYNTPVQTAGQIGNSQEFVTVDSDSINMSNTQKLTSTPLTIEAWAKCDIAAMSGSVGMIVARRTKVPLAGYQLSYFDGGGGGVSRINIQQYIVAGGASNYMTSSDDSVIDTWQYFTTSYNGVSNTKVYINGTDDSNPGPDTSKGDIFPIDAAFIIGARVEAVAPFQYYFDGLIDEVRISNVERSDAWIKASFDSQNQTSGFFTWNGGIDSGLVDTNAATNVGAFSATLNGYLRLNGSKTTSCGVRWRNALESVWSGNTTVSADVANGTAFSYTPTNLQSATKYYFQAWSDNSGGFSTGVEKTFTTTLDASAFDHYVQFIIDHDFIDEDLTDFPVLVVLNTTVGSAANGGNSIRFLTEDLSEVLYHDIDTWNSAESSYIWVSTDLSSTEDTHIVMFYGNASMTTANSTETWDENYLGVYHMNESTGSVCHDSTSNANHGTYQHSLPNPVTGMIGNGQDFDSTALDNVSLPEGVFIDTEGSFECWYESDALGVSQTLFYMRQDAQNYWLVKAAADNQYELVVANNNVPIVDIEAGSRRTCWEHWSCAAGVSNDAIEFINNSLIGTDTKYTLSTLTFGFARIGADTKYEADGIIDEVRISNIRRSNAWLKASFDLQNQTTGFFTWNGGIDSGLVHTNESTNIGPNYATIEGYLRLNGSKKTSVGFRWGTSPGSYTANVTISDDVANGTSFSHTPSQLNDSRDYYWQAWADNSGGFSTGVEKTFRTLLDYVNYSYQSPFLINRSFIDENLYNFPILVAINSTVAALCNGGNSIRFASPEGEQYYHQIDTWNPAGTSYVWVNITHIVPYWNTSVIMYYGNSAAISTNSTKTWDDNYIFVCHMNSTTATVYDATSNGNDGTKTAANDPVEVAGKIGQAQDFDRVNMENITLDSVIQGLDDMTVEAWYKAETLPSAAGKHQSIMASNLDGSKIAFRFFIHSGGDVVTLAVGDTNNKKGNTAITIGNWYYAAGTFSGTMLDVFLNGLSDDSSGFSPWVMTSSGGATMIGNEKTRPDYSANGIIDEVRVSDVVRSDAWINTSYNTMNNPSSFILWGGIRAPAVGTNAITDITTASAILNGHLVKNGSYATSYGFRYGVTCDDLSNNVTVGAVIANDTAYTYDTTGLNEGTVYYVQSWAKNSKGFSIGNIQTFWTNSVWANESLTYRRRITIENEGFICEDLTDFPILVAINSMVGEKCDNGNSIRFYKNNTAAEYYYDIDEWNCGATSYVWVNVTHVYDDADTVFYMYYNNSMAINNASNLTWNAEYLGVYHMNEIGGVLCNDSSRYGYNNGTYFGTLPTPINYGVGTGQQFVDVSNDYIKFSPSFNLSGNGTFEFFFKSTNLESGHILHYRHSGQDQFFLTQQAATSVWLSGWYVDNVAENFFYASSNINSHFHSYAYAPNGVMWRINGSEIGSSASAKTEIDVPTEGFSFGRVAYGGTEIDGKADELRISSVKRSNAWMDASFYSSSQITGFFEMGEEEGNIIQVQTNDPIAVFTQNATLSGTLLSVVESTTTVRFQLNNSSVSYLTGRNTTNQTLTSEQSFTNNTSLPPLNPGERHWYRAYANDTTTEVWGENKSFLTQPNASSGLSLTQGHLQITLTWTNNDGGDGCYVEYSENVDPGACWIPGGETPVPDSSGYVTTPYIHTGLTLDTIYYYKAWAYAEDDGWRSEVGNTVAPLNQTGITGNAKGVRMLQVSTNSTTGVEATNVTMWGYLSGAGIDAFATVRFQFNNSTGGAIYTPEGFWYWNTSNQTKSACQTFYNNTSKNTSLVLNPGDRYYFRAYANNTSTETWGANLSFLTKPYAQTGFNAAASEGAQITLNWTNQLGGDGCYIEYYENMPVVAWNSWSPGDYAANGSYQTTPYLHTGLSNSSVYSYKAWAYAEDDSWRSEVGNTSAPLNMSALTSNATCIGGINITTNATTGVEEMNATLWGWLNYTGDGTATVRFQYNNTTAFDINTTNQTKNSGDTFSQNIAGLTPGMFYHYRAYGNNTVNNTTGAHMVFLTKPNASTNFVISLVGGGDNGFNLTWTNNTGCNRTVVVRNNTSFPTDPYDGWEIYNGTNQSFIDVPLTNLHTYYYRIWAYANWTWDEVDYHQFSDGDISASRTYVSAPVVPFNSTSVTLTSAILRLYFDGGGTTYKVGWWVSCVNPTAASPGKNCTGVTTDVPGIYTYSATGLQPGQYYYIRAWAISATEFVNSTNTSYMIMIPNPPINLQATPSGGDSVQLNWVPYGAPGCVGGSPTKIRTVIRYSITTYPTGATGENGTATGIWIHNSSIGGTSYLHSGLAADTTYYYSMWTYANDTGSPPMNAWSSYSTISAGTEGGNYTIALRYENVSYGRIPLTRGAYHKFIVCYDDRTEYNFWDGSGNLITTGTYANESNITSIYPASGNFTFYAPARPLWMEFHWNDTDRGNEADFRCNRIIIPQTGQRNVTFYLRIDLPVFRETVFTINGTLVKYAYSFVDETGFFDTETNALAEIFFYNSSGTKIIVHSEYWDTELKMYPWLVYAKKYFLGVYCDDFSVANLGIAPSEQNEEPQIIIPFSYTETNNFFEYINLTLWWQDATTLGLTYLDTDYSSTNVTLKLYWWNNTLISTDYYSYLSNFNHFWMGLNNTYSYKIEIIVVNDIWPDGLSSGKIPFYGVVSLSVASATVDSVMETIFGKTPLWMENIDGSEREVPWSQVIIFSVAFILLVTLGKLNAFLGMSITGGWLIFSSAAISGVHLAGGAVLITIGIFLIALSIIGLLGGVERR